VVAVAEGSERDAVPERWNAAGADCMWMNMALDPRFATRTAPEGERATLSIPAEVPADDGDEVH